jgi:hypothetical protein
MRIIVNGGRNYSDLTLVEPELTKLHRYTPIDVVIHGCSGAHAGAVEHWARSRGIPIVRYPPNWERFGHRSEMLRNMFMIKDSRPDLLVAFPGGENTADLIQRAVNTGIAVLKIPQGCRTGPDQVACVGADATLRSGTRKAETQI